MLKHELHLQKDLHRLWSRYVVLMKMSNRTNFFAGVVLLLIAALFTACAHRPKIDPNINWNERIGSYTYEQAITELGKPDMIAESSEGRTVDWILKRSPNMSFGLGVGGG